MDMIVSLKSVSRVFKTGQIKVHAVNNVSLQIPQGSFQVIAGASGSGKTTLLNLIGGLDHSTSGEVNVAGRNLNTLDEQTLSVFRRHQAGFIFQGNNLLATLTAFENIEIPLILIGAPERKAKVETILADVGLHDKGAMFPQYLSAGEQQRVAVARALVHSPEIVLADEPTANLDSQTGAEIVELLKNLNRKLNRTILLATHDPRIIDRNENVIMLRDGKIDIYKTQT